MRQRNTGFGRLVVVLGVALLSCAGSVFAAGSHPVAPADITSLKDVAAVAIAPDGKRVVYTVTAAPTKKCPGVTHLWAVGTDGHPAGHRLPHTLAGDHAPAWAPDGHAYVFVRHAHAAADEKAAGDACSRGGDFAHSGSDLWISAGPGSAPHQLSHLEGSIKTFRWAPNGRVIAAVVTGGASGAGDHPDSAKNRGHRGVVYLVDAATGDAKPLGLPDDVTVYDLDWFPDSERLVLRFGNSTGYGAQFYESRLEIVNLSGRTLRTIDEKRVSYRHPSVSPDGGKLLFGRFFGQVGVAPVYTVLDLRNDTKTDIGANWPGTVKELRWDTGKRLAGVGLKGVTTFIVSADAGTGRISRELELQGQASDLGAGAEGIRAYIGNTRKQPNEVWLYDMAGKHARVITDTNPQVRSWRVADIRPVHWQSSVDDTELFGLLALPAGWRDGEPLKMLVQPHGGPLYAWQDGWQGTWEAWAQVLTGQGYAVFMPNPRGSIGQGHAFANANVMDWGGGDYRDILDGVEKLVADGVADPDTLAVGGWSYGGYMSSWAAGHNDHDVRFKAAIVGAAPTDLFLMAFSSDLGYVFTGSYLGDPFENRKLYMQRSPVSAVRDVSIPTLVLHGADDHRVPTANGKLFFNALKHYGKISRLVVYPHATHWLSVSVGSEAQDDVQERVVEWLERYLGSARDTTEF